MTPQQLPLLPLLKIEELHLSLKNGTSSNKILQGISFDVYPGEIVALVGESGSGKSSIASAIFALLPSPHTLTGKIEFEGENLLEPSSNKISLLRGTKLSLILQDPSLALNPLVPLGKQLIEGLCYHKKISWKEGWQKGIEWLNRVGVNNPKERMNQYPHEISGGMKQRILIAMALICSPSLLIADEPTTALDVTTQAQILDILKHLQEEEKMSLLLITHDLGVVAKLCHRVIVISSGKIIETGSVEQIFHSPKHPYTEALLKDARKWRK